MVVRFVIAFLVFSLAGCARSMPPPGGPADTTPPFVAETVPAAKATSVSTHSAFRLIFSESISCGTVGRSITFLPDARFDDTNCGGREFSAGFADSLATEQTYVVTIEPGIEDKHGIRSRESYVFAFSTGDSLDLATLHGLVARDTTMVSGALVWATFESPQPDTLGIVREWDYMTTSGEGGTFTLEYLKPGGYYLTVFVDKNANGRYETDSESGVMLDAVYQIKSRRDRIEDVVLTLPLEEPADIHEEQ